MGFNRRKMDDERRREADKRAAAKRALDPQVKATVCDGDHFEATRPADVQCAVWARTQRGRSTWLEQ